MAVPHFSVSIVSRGDGRSAVLSAAYRHCARMDYEREARTVDYSAKQGLLHEEFLIPADPPPWLRALIADRSVAGTVEAFWNQVEAFEKRSDAQLAKDVTIALPLELSAAQNVALVRDFVGRHVLSKGMVADWVYHDAPGNPHVHLMMTLRPLTDEGFGAKKVAVLDANGEPLRNAGGKIVYELWAGGAADFDAFRDGWFACQNRHLALAGLDLSIDGRSYKKQGIEVEPTIHIGVGTKAIDRKARERSWSPKLDRLEQFEETREDNRRRIDQRPEIVIDMISREKSVFDERDIAKILHRYVDDAVTFQSLIARILQSPQVLRIDRDSVDFATGERLRARYTTRELIRLEAEMASRSIWLAAQSSHGLRIETLAPILERHARLSGEQRAAIEHLVGAERIVAVVGRAGAGKTTMMKTAREAWAASGYRVVGGALAGKAAEGLEKEAGILSRTLASWELRWKEGRDTLDQKAVFVLDEAGMVASRQMAFFVETVMKSGAKLVLVGDPEQLQPIEAGAAFRAIVDRIGYAELETIYRQQEAWMRAASLDLARGRIGEAVAAYRAQGRIIGSQLKADAIASLITEWNRDYDPSKTTLILAHLRRDVRQLNELARAKLVERGLIGEGHDFRTEDGPRRFAAGDQIVFLRNEGALGVKNGMIGRLVEAGPGRIVAEIGEGESRRRVTVEQRFYANVDHGYATTIHKSQGATVDRVKVLASLSLDRHLTYVAMTRHREDLTVHYGRRPFAKAGGLVQILARRNAKETTLDYEHGSLYRQALRFAENRGLNIVSVARTLVRDRLRWTLRQKGRLVELATRLRSLGERLRTSQSRTPVVRKETPPMVAGISVFPTSLEDKVEHKLQLDPTVSKQWENVSSRFRLVFADAETAFRAMNFAAIVTDSTAAREALDQLGKNPASLGPLRGRTGLLAGTKDKNDRRVAELNVSALIRDIESYLRVRQRAVDMIEKDERELRQRNSIDIPALSPEARSVLEKVRDAIDRNDLPAAVGFAVSNREIKAEIDAFGKAVSDRFGERTLLVNAAREPDGGVFGKAAEGLRGPDREKLREAWPLLRTVQQLAAHERTSARLKQAEELRLSQQQSRVMKP
ncbi:Ti-type conjugative transfer relaxase TraA [Chelatococcus asaccharovorans]|uniref:Ti-type conjugative transfer relaxase TraA n=1 Tax=Chelatococcus asaccharovorans TaxID=28210 RepID=UPI00224C6C63|nr:Ti-type conjugative transfer relaxase TraA [Chelatococcus asaccharovorans]CAH1660836.1 Conjugal transfer protein TraA [Chelatococcus asaccharovorans]CAH1690224.1 Conjugal transfer protein TraA [Chelatococcus asaccharovorans]